MRFRSHRILVVAAVVCLLGLLGQTAPAESVFHYSFSDATVLPTVVDQGGAANDGVAGPAASLSGDVPTAGVPAGAGNRSLISAGGTRAVQTGVVAPALQRLSNANVAAAGGFTMEAWLNWNGSGTVNSLIDYAGTEKIILDQRGADPTLVQMRFDGFGDLPIGNATANQWHYAAVVFDTGGNPVNGDGTITGTVTTYFDGLTPSNVYTNVTKGTFGDSLNRSIGVGQHPIGFDLDFFEGSVFEPRVTLGALAAGDLLFVPEPGTVMMLIAGALGLMLLAVRRRAA